MECIEVQSLIGSYIEDTMSEKKMMEFIQHVMSCRTCYDELETHFVIHYAIKYLDEDLHASYNFQKMFIEDLKRKESNIKTRRSTRFSLTLYISFIAFTFLLVALYIFLPEEQNFVASAVDEINRFLVEVMHR